MTQQQYYPSEQPQQFQQPAPQPYAQPAPQPGGYLPVQQGYPQQPQAFAPQGYPQVPQQPAVPLADGSLDAFYSQPTLGGGPGISWKGKPDGYTVQGVVPRDVTNADVSQEVGAPNTAEAGKPKFYRDGRPMFVMAVPLQVPVSQEFPEGEARLYVRGQLREALAAAMTQAGAQGSPAAGATITVTLVQRKQGRGAIPQNIFAVTYTPPGGQPPQVSQQVQAPQAQQQVAQPMQQPAPQVQVQQPQPQAQALAAQAPAQQLVQPVPQQVAPQQPQAQPGQQMQAPPGFDQQQMALLAQLTGQQQG